MVRKAGKLILKLFKGHVLQVFSACLNVTVNVTV
jgi:hypothetical protein